MGSYLGGMVTPEMRTMIAADVKRCFRELREAGAPIGADESITITDRGNGRIDVDFARMHAQWRREEQAG